MPFTYLRYKLNNGFIDNWLAAGPLAKAAGAGPAPEAGSGITEPVVDAGTLGQPNMENPHLRWRYTHCRADHFIDLTARYAFETTVRAWAYARLNVAQPQAVDFAVTTQGTAEIWLNGQSAGRHEHQDLKRPLTHRFPVQLQAGENEILVHFENSGVRVIPCVLALEVQGLVDAGAEVVLPTNIAPELLTKRQGLETLIDSAIIDRYVYGYLGGDRYDRNEPVTLHFPENLTVEAEMSWRLQSLNADIFQEGTQVLGPGKKVAMARKFPLRNGPHHLALAPNRLDFHEKLLRVERKELFYVARSPYGLAPDPQPEDRRQKALEDAAVRRNESVYVELAKMALGKWEKVNQKVLDRALGGIEQRLDGAVADLLGLLGGALRHKKKQPIIRDLRKSLQPAALNFLYSPDEAGDAERQRINFSGESQQILFHACEILAGQMFAAEMFASTGKDGDWHQSRGEERAIDWMRQRGRYGFAEWQSPTGAEAIVAALTHLVDLASNDTVRELASVLLDKLFFSLAANSFRGAYGSTSGSSDTGSVLSPRLQPTSGINRLLWGAGNFNEHVLGYISLATCQRYDLPSVLYRIAAQPDNAVWSRERHMAAPSGAPDGEPGIESVVTAAFKTQDYLLACAQDYKPGQRGQSEHIWQASLGPDSVVFVNHPSNMSEDDNRRPNLWAGNGVLPRAAQWGDVVIAIYQLPEDDWLGFTHAYFPGKTFDEYAVDDKWAFARKGEGYLALTAARGLDYITTGQTAGRELRSVGRENVWLCHMGQKALDGAFAEFQQKVRAMELAIDGLSIRLHSLRGEAIEFGWERPLLINGAEQPLASTRHIENVYCLADAPANQLEIIHKGEGIRLKFE